MGRKWGGRVGGQEGGCGEGELLAGRKWEGQETWAYMRSVMRELRTSPPSPRSLAVQSQAPALSARPFGSRDKKPMFITWKLVRS